MKTGLAIGLVALFAGCTGGGGERPEPPLARLDLRAALQATAELKPVGLAIAPDGQRFVFEEAAGLYRLEGDRAVLVVPMSGMPDPGPTAPVKLPFTDLVAVAPNVFAITAIGDGYLLDTAAMTLRPHFCYVPDDGPTTLSRRTDAIAYDAVHERLYAQPNTYDADVLQYTELASYERASGNQIGWYPTPTDMVVTGMVSIPEVGLVLGHGSRLSRFDPATYETILLDDLDRFGVRSIDGLAVDAAAGALVVIDQQTDTVFDIGLSRLTL